MKMAGVGESGEWRQCAALIGRGLGRLSKELAKLSLTPWSVQGGIPYISRDTKVSGISKVKDFTNSKDSWTKM